MSAITTNNEVEVVDSKVYIVDEFLPPNELDFILHLVSKLENKFEASSFLSETESVVDKKRRKSILIEKDIEPVHNILLKQLLNFRVDLQREYGCKLEMTEKYFCQLVASNDGDFFIPHRDNLYGDKYKLKTTIVFYFHKEPKSFEGGEFFIWDRFINREGNFLENVPSKGTMIEPLNNRLIVFDGDCLHEALPVKCESKEFMDSRFCVVLRLP